MHKISSIVRLLSFSLLPRLLLGCVGFEITQVTYLYIYSTTRIILRPIRYAFPALFVQAERIMFCLLELCLQSKRTNLAFFHTSDFLIRSL